MTHADCVKVGNHLTGKATPSSDLNDIQTWKDQLRTLNGPRFLSFGTFIIFL